MVHIIPKVPEDSSLVTCSVGAIVVSWNWRASSNLASPPVTCDITQETNPLKECPEVPPLPSTPRAVAWHHGNLPCLLVGGNLTLFLFEPISSFLSLSYQPTAGTSRSQIFHKQASLIFHIFKTKQIIKVVVRMIKAYWSKDTSVMLSN